MRRTAWIAGIGLSLLSIYWGWYRHWMAVRVYIPGQWLGEVGWSPNVTEELWFCVFFVISTLFWIVCKKWILCALFAFLALIPSYLPALRPEPMDRAQDELRHYQNAIRTKQRYGDQYELQVDGRKLTYWLWMTWNLDNARGVMYDPQDRLTISSLEDALAFKLMTHGVLFKIEKLAPCWYFVEHS